MQLTVLGSSSKGNSYLLHSKHEALMIECGISFDKVKAALDFDISIIKGCILTHEHKDHSRYLQKVAEAGIEVFSSSLTFKALNASHHNFMCCEHKTGFFLENFFILPLRVEHDSLEPFCFIISHPDIGNMLFMTDTFCSRYAFDDFKLHQILIEANYSHEIVKANILAGASLSLRNRILFSHMELGTTLALLRSYVSKSTQNVVLIHLSDSNSNSSQFKAAAQSICSYPAKVFIAEPDLSIPLNKNPF